METVIKIGILKETKHPAEKRAPMTPVQATRLKSLFPNLKIIVQRSNTRIFNDEEYQKEGIQVQDNLDDCDWLIGIKEVNKEDLLEGKNYMFFSHVIKKQAHNRDLFKEILRKKISLIDYELFTDERGSRLVAFGRWAGIVGAYNGLRAWGMLHNQYELKPAYLSHSSIELCTALKGIGNHPTKILVTGEGRVAGGVLEMLDCFGAKKIDPNGFLSGEFDFPVYCQIGPQQYTRHVSGQNFDFRHFALFPMEYRSIFQPFTRAVDILITAHYWDPAAPKMISVEDMLQPDFRIHLIADISCDVNGPIESTLRASTIEKPFYDFDPIDRTEKPAFSHKRNITVMAVDNLPAELPRDSSESFGETLLAYIFPVIAGAGDASLLERATIVKKGMITSRFHYLKDWAK